MKPDITLIDGNERHRENPVLFQVPSDLQKQSIQSGDWVMIGAEDHLDRAGKSCLTPERFWIRVTSANKQGLVGLVIDELPSAEYYGLHHGDSLSFEGRHVLDIETIEQQQMPKQPRPKAVKLTVETLNGELPRVPFANCELSDHTSIVISRSADIIRVAVFLRPGMSDEAASMGDLAYAKALTVAATSLGLIPDGCKWRLPKEICVFVVTLPLDVTGPELLKRVREAIELVLAKAKRTLRGELQNQLVSKTDGDTSAQSADTDAAVHSTK